MDIRTGTAEDERLVRSLRITASQTSGIAGGGATLVFTAEAATGGKPRLRAAAGFRNAEEARGLATKIDGLVQAALASAQPKSGPLDGPVAGREGAEGLLAIPLVARGVAVGRRHRGRADGTSRQGCAGSDRDARLGSRLPDRSSGGGRHEREPVSSQRWTDDERRR